MYVSYVWVGWCVCGGQRTACWSQFSPSTIRSWKQHSGPRVWWYGASLSYLIYSVAFLKHSDGLTNPLVSFPSWHWEKCKHLAPGSPQGLW